MWRDGVCLACVLLVWPWLAVGRWVGKGQRGKVYIDARVKGTMKYGSCRVRSRARLSGPPLSLAENGRRNKGRSGGNWGGRVVQKGKKRISEDSFPHKWFGRPDQVWSLNCVVAEWVFGKREDKEDE